MRTRYIVLNGIIETLFLYLAITRPNTGVIMFMGFGVLMLIAILFHLERQLFFGALILLSFPLLMPLTLIYGVIGLFLPQRDKKEKVKVTREENWFF